jgi:hypothetical protein
VGSGGNIVGTGASYGMVGKAGLEKPTNSPFKGTGIFKSLTHLDPEDGSNICLRKVSNIAQNHTI